MSKSTNTQKERRSSVRVTGRNLFDFKILGEEKYNALVEDFDNGISLYTQQSLMDIQMFVGAQNALSRIADKDPDLAEFLQHLDMKMNVLLQKADGKKSPIEALKLRDLNLSGSGIAFIADEQIPAETILEMRIVLLPNYVFIYVIGRITECEKIQNEQDKTFYKLRVAFTLIMDNDREKLIQHNFRQQSLALRNRRKRKCK
jgi:hypothetical protein